MADENLAERIRRLEDREAIRDLCSRYSIFVDNHDFANLGSLFARDARYGWVGEPPHAEGREAVRNLLESRIGPSGPSFHVNHDMIVDWGEDPDRATGLVSCHAEVTPGGRQFVGAIRYHDSYVREDGRWLFAERLLGFLYFAPPACYADLLLQKERLLHTEPPSAAHWPSFTI